MTSHESTTIQIVEKYFLRESEYYVIIIRELINDRHSRLLLVCTVKLIKAKLFKVPLV